MRHRSKRGSFADDCLLASFTLGLTAVPVMCFQRMFPWQATFALLIVPTLLLCRHLRYRAAAVAAGMSLLAGLWIIVPPRWSLHVDIQGAAALLIFAGAAALTIAITVKASHRKPAATASNA